MQPFSHFQFLYKNKYALKIKSINLKKTKHMQPSIAYNAYPGFQI